MTEEDDDPEIAYFREIERAFVQRRGDPLFISNADFVFLSRLWKRGIPKRIVLRGMADAFDAHAHSFARKQKIRSLKFCEDQIKAAVDRYRKSLQAEGPSRRDLSTALRALDERVGAISPEPGMAEAVATARLRLRGIADAVDQNRTFDAEPALAGLEDDLVAAAASALGPGESAEIEQASRDATSAYKSRMPANVYENLIGESVRRKTLQRFGLPRFLLAEIE